MGMCSTIYTDLMRTVPYEGDNFANSNMDHFSLIFENFLKTERNFFYVNAQQEAYLKVKKLFKAKTSMFRKA